jgi:hypothetical protein
MAGSVQQLIIFLPSLSCSRLTAAWAQWNSVGGNAGEEGAACQAAMAAGAQSAVAPGLQGVERALETQAFDGSIGPIARK